MKQSPRGNEKKKKGIKILVKKQALEKKGVVLFHSQTSDKGGKDRKEEYRRYNKNLRL